MYHDDPSNLKPFLHSPKLALNPEPCNIHSATSGLPSAAAWHPSLVAWRI